MATARMSTSVKVGEPILLIWPPSTPSNAPAAKATRSKPKPMVWEGIATDEVGPEKLMSGKIGVPDGAMPQNVRGVQSITWSEDFDSAAMNVSVEVWDPSGECRRMSQPGSWMYLAVVVDGSVWEVGSFYIWEDVRTDTRTNTVTITGLDLCSRLDRVGGEDRVWRKKTPGQIAREIGKRFGVKMRIENPGRVIKYLQFSSASPYEQIVQAYEQDTALTGNRWRVRAVGDTIWIYKVNQGGQDAHQVDYPMPVLRSADSERGNIISSSLVRSMDEKRTIIYARGAQREGNAEAGDTTKVKFPYVVVKTQDVARYGPLIETIDLSSDQWMTTAQMKKAAINHLSIYGGVRETGSFQIPGHPVMRAGWRIRVEDVEGTGLFGYYYVSSLTTTITGSTISTSIETSKNAVTPKIVEKAVDQSEMAVGNSLFGGAQLGAETGIVGGNMTGTEGIVRRGVDVVTDALNAAYAIKTITAWAKQKYPQSTLLPFTSYLVNYCVNTKLDPYFFAAIAAAENAWGTRGGGRYNTWGMKPGGRLANYSSWNDGIQKAAGNLNGSLYRGAKKYTVGAIGARWAPLGAGDDPTGLNNHWAKNVVTFMRQMGRTDASTSTRVLF